MLMSLEAFQTLHRTQQTGFTATSLTAASDERKTPRCSLNVFLSLPWKLKFLCSLYAVGGLLDPGGPLKAFSASLASV